MRSQRDLGYSGGEAAPAAAAGGHEPAAAGGEVDLHNKAGETAVKHMDHS